MTEKRFVQSHSGFWNALLPMEEPYVRAHNSSLKRFAPAMRSVISPDQRGLINELAFRLFVAGTQVSVMPSDLSTELVNKCAEETARYLAGLTPPVSRISPASFTRVGVGEAKGLAMRLASYFLSRHWRIVLTSPLFQGCGWLAAAEGDVLADETLIEIKAGDRLFRSIDVRQLLCYCALNFSAKSYEIKSICLLNPRSGTYFTDELEHLCQQAAGTSAPNVLGAIVNYISEPFGDTRAEFED
jgi:hypothetical protein